MKNEKSSNTAKTVLSILSIIFGIIGLVSSCFIIGLGPSIASLILGIIALVKKDKKAIGGLICSTIAIVISISMLVWMISDISKEMEVEKLIESRDYDTAIELIDSYNFSKSVKDDFYYDIYIGQENYDEAFQILFSSIKENYQEIDTVSENDLEKMNSIYEFLSEENKAQLDQFKIDREKVIEEKAEKEKAEKEAEEKAKAEKEAKEKAKKEAEEKAKAEKEAKEKAEKEAKEKAEKEAAEKAKAEKEAKEKAEKEAAEKAKAEKEAEEKAKAEKEAKDKEDKTKYGITYDEFVQILCSYSDPPVDFETEEELEAYFRDLFETWKEDPMHFGWKKDTEGNWYYEQPIDKYEIENNAIYPGYKDLLRYRESYLNKYVVMVVCMGTDISGGEYIVYETEYYSGIDDYLSSGEPMIVKDSRYYNDMRWLEGDYIKIYGKFLGVENRTFQYKLTGNDVEMETPVIEVYYGDLMKE